eukprot:SAG31_NODE_79_length_27235_cov_6.268868_13_plen_89_part_00
MLEVWRVTFLGMDSPQLPRAQNRIPLLEDTLQHFVVLDINTQVTELQPVIETMEDHTELAPQVSHYHRQTEVFPDLGIAFFADGTDTN